MKLHPRFDLISWESKSYPNILREIHDPPPRLMVRGRWPLWEERLWVAVVGARKATPFGLKRTREIVADLVAHDIGIVSGLAYGIDGQAHRVAVEKGGITWGVLGSGIDIFYPKGHRALAEKMTEKGGYLSEYPLGMKPYAGNFPKRNRIISGLSHAVLLIEATLRSGSLITARLALEQGREVFVVPPPKEHVAYEGTKKLLEEGATPYESVEQLSEILQPMFGNPSSKKREKKQRLKEEFATLEKGHPFSSLLHQPRTLDYLVQKTQKSPHQLLVELLLLESRGLIQKKEGAVWQNR